MGLEMNHKHVAMIMAGLQAVRVRIASTVSEGAGIPDLVHGPEAYEIVREIEAALDAPGNHLTTPAAKRPPRPEATGT